MIYLDHNATTPMDPQVLEAMLPYLKEHFGNPSSESHPYGWQAKAAVEHARKLVASVIQASPEEVIFTSGATESNNLALLGYARANGQFGKHLITVSTEHKAILDTCHQLEREGFEVTYLNVDHKGFINIEELKKSIRKDTILISVMAANNEVGTLQDIKKIGEIAHENNICFHSDAAQAFGKMNIDVNELNIDMLSISGHKIYGPKGVGALFIKKKKPKLELQALNFGGGQEGGLRPGTLNVAGIVGLGKSSEIVLSSLEKDQEHLQSLNKLFLSSLQNQLSDIVINGPKENRLCSNLNLSFIGVPSAALMMELREVAVSSGSACASGNASASYVLQAMQLSEKKIQSAIRFGFGRFNTQEEILKAAELVIQAVKKLRGT
ncbi:MAG: cysteine desulfurase [Deltaproteobacteria bacterium]|nr:cysteine desulfurase [Deltaproteobacteria bacterium]